MKRKLSLIYFFSFVLLWAQVVLAANEAPIELGKKIFNDRTFAGSTNDWSCSTCHQDDKEVGKASEKSASINRCIVGALNGQELHEDSKEMKALKTYIQSLTK